MTGLQEKKATPKNPLISLAEMYGLGFALDLSSFALIRKAESLLPYSFVRKHSLIPLEKRGKSLLVAITDPLNFEAKEEVRALLDVHVEEILAPKEEVERAIEICYKQKEEAVSDEIEALTDSSEQKVEESEGYDLLEKSSESPVIRLLNAILTEAIQHGVSDIHFDPGESGLCVRYRIDGVLQTRHHPPKDLQLQLIARIKVMAKLDIAESRLPQDGRIKLKLGKRQIDFRVSTIPVAFGERVVLRILDKNHVLLGLSKLGMEEEIASGLAKLLKVSEGIILVTGPTGSGKTTTLYSALSQIQSPEINIMTIEDPVEFKLQGMAQIGVNPKIDLTFAKGLRHILRQDPDVIMIGEIRDVETAEIAIQSSLTGHLVLSTLHTNDAPSALTRLVEMGIEPYLLSSSVIGVLAQRLVRKLCPSCKRGYTPSDAELLELGIKREEIESGVLFQNTGCEDCFYSGYLGRHGIYELMQVGAKIKQQIMESADAEKLRKVAIKNGMQTLRESGIALALRGITSLAEVLRVARGYEEV